MTSYLLGFFEFLSDFIDRTIIKIGAGTSVGMGAWSKVANIDWMAIAAGIIAVLTIISLLVKIALDFSRFWRERHSK